MRSGTSFAVFKFVTFKVLILIPQCNKVRFDYDLYWFQIKLTHQIFF